MKNYLTESIHLSWALYFMGDWEGLILERMLHLYETGLNLECANTVKSIEVTWSDQTNCKSQLSTKEL